LLVEVGDDTDVEEVGDAREGWGEDIVIWFNLANLMTDGGHLDG
jgi:hypothetical protein